MVIPKTCTSDNLATVAIFLSLLENEDSKVSQKAGKIISPKESRFFHGTTSIDGNLKIIIERSRTNRKIGAGPISSIFLFSLLSLNRGFVYRKFLA